MILVIDFEATCVAPNSHVTHRMEIIEIGAVWAAWDGTIESTFQEFARPFQSTELTEFCMQLTGITQADIDRAAAFPVVVEKLSHFIVARAELDQPRVWGSWGNFDYDQLIKDCAMHAIPNPLSDFRHLNLKRAFAKKRKIKEVGVARALNLANVSRVGVAHRALDDARNIASLLPWC